MDFNESVCHSLSPVFEILYYFCLILGTTKPVNWPKPVYMLDPAEPDNNGFINEDFIVWMRTAALPTFRKLYRLIERKNNLQPTLQAGKYSLDIAYSILWKQIFAGLHKHVFASYHIELAFLLAISKKRWYWAVVENWHWEPDRLLPSFTPVLVI